MTLEEKVDMLGGPKGWNNPNCRNKFHKIAKMLVDHGFTIDQACGILAEVRDTSLEENKV